MAGLPREFLPPMPMQAFVTTLKILLFRAGPQDFPYSAEPTLNRACIAIAVLACTLFFGLAAPTLAAFAAGAIAVAGVAMFTRVLLRLRKLDSRQVQTLDSLLAAGSVLLVLMCLPVAQLMPQMREYLAQIEQNPDLANQPGHVPDFPPGPALLADLLSVWFVAVSAHVFRQAGNLGYAASALVALLCIFNVTMLLLFASPLIALFGG